MWSLMMQGLYLLIAMTVCCDMKVLLECIPYKMLIIMLVMNE